MSDTVSLASCVRRFSFFALLRQLEAEHPQRPRLGQTLSPNEEALRLSQAPSLHFAASELVSFTPAQEGKPAELSVNLQGLIGPEGPLPLCLTEYIHQRLQHGDDPTWHHFLNIFQHRLLSLYYRAWAAAQPAIAADRPEDDFFARAIASVCGLDLNSAHDTTVPNHAKLHLASLLAGPRHSAANLAAVLSEYFRLPVQIEMFVGEYLPLTDSDSTRLGRCTQTLGQGVVLGQRVWSVQHRFRVVFGPLSFRDFQRLQPEGTSFQALAYWVRWYSGGQWDWQLELRLMPDAWHAARLGENSRIGRHCWLGRPKAPRLRLNPGVHTV